MIVGIVTLVMFPVYFALLILGSVVQAAQGNGWAMISLVTLLTAGVTAIVCRDTLPGTITAIVMYILFALMEMDSFGGGKIDNLSLLAFVAAILMTVSMLISLRVGNNAQLPPPEDVRPPEEPDEQ
jgi:hypothetical protein